MTSKEISTCIVGIGNTLRSDDGAGAYVCRLMEEKRLPAVAFIITQQLDIAMVEQLTKFDRVIFVDAALNESNFSFQTLSPENSQPQSFSHHINAAMLVSLAKQLFAARTQFYICAIGATDFEMGDHFSEATLSNAREAAAFLSGWIKTNT